MTDNKLFEKYLNQASDTQLTEEAKTPTDAEQRSNATYKKISAIFKKMGYSISPMFIYEQSGGDYGIEGGNITSNDFNAPSIIIKNNWISAGYRGGMHAPILLINIPSIGRETVEEFKKRVAGFEKIAKGLEELQKVDWTKLPVEIEDEDD